MTDPVLKTDPNPTTLEADELPDVARAVRDLGLKPVRAWKQTATRRYEAQELSERGALANGRNRWDTSRSVSPCLRNSIR